MIEGREASVVSIVVLNLFEKWANQQPTHDSRLTIHEPQLLKKHPHRLIKPLIIRSRTRLLHLFVKAL